MPNPSTIWLMEKAPVQETASILAPGDGLRASASAFLGWRGVTGVHFRSTLSPSQIRQLAVFYKPRLAVGFARLFSPSCNTEILLDFLLDLPHRS